MAKTYRKYKESYRTHNSKFKKSMQEQEKYSKHEIEYQDKISGKHRWKRNNMNQHEF
jgi:hypothetical protein|tara:strand:+ start:1226 stop:1396 length:171 start_codon:yes stop_codon:yes gene_type:complete